MNPFRILREYRNLTKECTTLAIENVKLHKKLAHTGVLIDLVRDSIETIKQTEIKRDYYKDKYFKLKYSQDKK